MNENFEDRNKKQTEPIGEDRSDGNGGPRKPTANGLSDRNDNFQVPDISALKEHPGVLGSIVIGFDGNLLDSDLATPRDQLANLSINALATYMNTGHALKKLGQNICHQIVTKTDRGYNVIAAYNAGLVLTLCDGDGTEVLVPLMRGLTTMTFRAVNPPGH